MTGSAHQSQNSPLGRLELAEARYEPAEGDDGVLDQHRHEFVPVETEGADRSNGSRRGDVWLTPEHGYVPEHIPFPGSGYDAPLAVRYNSTSPFSTT